MRIKLIEVIMFDSKLKAEEISKILDFFMRNQNDTDKYAFSMDEIIEYTDIRNLTHEKLMEFKEIITCEYEKNGTNKWYRYESIEKQVLCAMNELVKDGLIREEFKDGKIVYLAH